MTRLIENKMERLHKDVRLGWSGKHSRIIRSESNGMDHKVSYSMSPTVKFKCDCTTHGSFSVCAHSLLSALDNNLLIKYIENVVKTERNK